MKQESILGLTETPGIPNAPTPGADSFLRHLFKTVEAQRNLALSALAELVGKYEVLKEQYAAHVKKLTGELTVANDQKGRLATENAGLKLRIAELENGGEPIAAKSVTQSAPKSKKLDKT